MSKYIIDIPNVIEWGVVTCRTEDGFYTRDFDSLEELNSDYINEHFGDLQDTAYQRGLDDAWEVVKALFQTFGTESACVIMKNDNVHGAIDRLKAYEEKQKADDKIDEKITGFLDCNGYTVDEVINRLKRMTGGNEA